MGLRRFILVSLSGFRNRIEETRVKLGRNVDLCGKITCQKAGLRRYFLFSLRLAACVVVLVSPFGRFRCVGWQRRSFWSMPRMCSGLAMNVQCSSTCLMKVSTYPPMSFPPGTDVGEPVSTLPRHRRTRRTENGPSRDCRML